LLFLLHDVPDVRCPATTRNGGFLSMRKDSVARRVWYVASVMMLLTGDSYGATKQLSPFGDKAAALSLQHRELQDSCEACDTEIVLEDDDAEMSCAICTEVLDACVDAHGGSESGSGFGICHPCGDLSVAEVLVFYQGICGDPLSSVTIDYISDCLYDSVPSECPDVTAFDDVYATTPSPSTDDETITPPTTITEDSGVRIRACGSVGALVVAVVNVLFFLTEMR
ncbi:unnamed protein product, partial [Ectocarpus sp. 6 AP-2014]